MPGPALLFGSALIVTLCWAAVSDLRCRKIPDAASLVLVGLWPLHLVAAASATGIVSGLVAAAAVFAAGFAAWHRGLLGGGDVKLLTALALWAGTGLLLPLLLLTAIVGGALAVAWLGLGLLRAHLPTPAMPVLGAAGLPYGVAISLSGLWLSWRLFWA